MKIGFLLIPAISLLIAVPQAFAADGKALFEANCTSCHGNQGQGGFSGVPNLITSGRLAKPDKVLVDHIMKGFRSPDSQMGMPEKGGDASLTEDDAEAILVYLRAIPHSPK